MTLLDVNSSYSIPADRLTLGVNNATMPLPDNVPEYHRHRMSQFYRLILSYGDFKHAKVIAQYILAEKLHAKYPGEMTNLLQALNCSMVMAYARPFSGNSGAIPDLPARYLKILTPEEREIHKEVLFDRNKYMAHTDAEAVDLEPVRLQVEHTREVLIPLVADRLAPLDEQATKHFMSAAAKLLQKVVEERHAQEPDFIQYFRVAGPYTLFGATD